MWAWDGPRLFPSFALLCMPSVPKDTSWSKIAECWSSSHPVHSPSPLSVIILYSFNQNECWVIMLCCCYCSVAKSCPTLWPMDCSTPGLLVYITNSWSLLKLMSIELVMLYNQLILCHSLLLLPLIFPSIRVFSNESAVYIRWPKYWSFSFSISLFSEYSELISFSIDWFDLPAAKGILKSSWAPQFKNINSLALSLLHGPTLASTHDYWKTIALTILTLVNKVMSPLFNMLSRFVIAFPPRSKRLLISWL